MKRIRIFNVSITLIVLLALTTLVMTSCKKEVIKKEKEMSKELYLQKENNNLHEQDCFCDSCTGEPDRTELESKVIITKPFKKDYEIDLTQDGYLIKDERGVHSIAFDDLEEWFIADNL